MPSSPFLASYRYRCWKENRVRTTDIEYIIDFKLTELWLKMIFFACHVWPLLMRAKIFGVARSLPEIGTSLKPNQLNQVKLVQIIVSDLLNINMNENFVVKSNHYLVMKTQYGWDQNGNSHFGSVFVQNTKIRFNDCIGHVSFFNVTTSVSSSSSSATLTSVQCCSAQAISGIQFNIEFKRKTSVLAYPENKIIFQHKKFLLKMSHKSGWMLYICFDAVFISSFDLRFVDQWVSHKNNLLGQRVYRIMRLKKFNLKKRLNES